MKYFRYYQHDPGRCEDTVGIIVTTSLLEAKDVLKKHYPSTNIDRFELKEIILSEDGLYEMYYG